MSDITANIGAWTLPLNGRGDWEGLGSEENPQTHPDAPYALGYTLTGFPAGFSVDAAGLLSGTFGSAGVYYVTIIRAAVQSATYANLDRLRLSIYVGTAPPNYAGDAGTAAVVPATGWKQLLVNGVLQPPFPALNESQAPFFYLAPGQTFYCAIPALLFDSDKDSATLVPGVFPSPWSGLPDKLITDLDFAGGVQDDCFWVRVPGYTADISGDIGGNIMLSVAGNPGLLSTTVGVLIHNSADGSGVVLPQSPPVLDADLGDDVGFWDLTPLLPGMAPAPVGGDLPLGMAWDVRNIEGEKHFGLVGAPLVAGRFLYQLNSVSTPYPLQPATTISVPFWIAINVE